MRTELQDQNTIPEEERVERELFWELTATLP